MIDSFKIYVDGILCMAYYDESKFKAECYRLEKELDTLFNERGGRLKTNVKIRDTYHNRIF